MTAGTASEGRAGTVRERVAPTRERILDAAIDLFGRQGYSATSVGEIEQAVGLKPRSGALYKHYPSKRALLEAAMARRARAVDESIAELVGAATSGDPRVDLRVIGRAALHEIGNDQPVLRIVMREGDNAPDLRDEFYARVVSRGHGQLLAWLRETASRAGVELDDPAALAAVMLGSIVSFRVLETLFGRPPNDVGEKRFLEAWTDSSLKLLEAHGLVATDNTPREARR
jgi:AcrR family transcriptional regulator